MTKKDEDNPDYVSIVLCSKGLGANYAKENELKHRWNGEKIWRIRNITYICGRKVKEKLIENKSAQYCIAKGNG